MMVIIKTGEPYGSPVFFRGDNERKKTISGFTLIELMIVVAIIGILTAIALPQFSSFRVKAFNATAETDLRNLMVNEEAYFAGNQQFTVPSVSSAAGSPGPAAGIQGSYISRGIGYSIVSVASGAGYAVYTGHDKGNTTYGGNETGLLRRNKLAVGINPKTSAAAENAALTSGWGTGDL